MRERLNARKFELLFTEWEESNLTVKDFCENFGMSRPNWYKWCKKLNKAPYDQGSDNEFLTIDIPKQRGEKKFPHSHLFEVTQNTFNQHHLKEPVQFINNFVQSKQDFPFEENIFPIYTDNKRIFNEDTCSFINKKDTSNPTEASPIEFIFPNGTKMKLRENISLDLIKKIVHLYD